MTFRVLTVCTGNICRSPVAQLIVAKELSAFATAEISSAGTGALVGAGVPEPAQRLAAADGIDASRHRARQIDAELIRGADLLVALSRDHRRLIVEEFPGAMRRAFTLRELARVADAVEPSLADAVRNASATTPEEGMRAAVALAATMRGTVAPPSHPEELDVVDPYRRSDEVYRQSYRELAPAAARVGTYLRMGAVLAVQPH